MTIRAFLFDFDGLLADSEPLHLAGFRAVAAPWGVRLDDETYYREFVGYDDRDGFRALWRSEGLPEPDHVFLADLIARKAAHVETLMQTAMPSRPGAVAFARAACAGWAAGVCSGALRREIELGLRGLGLDDLLIDRVTADDVARSKPDPEGYLALIGLLGARLQAAGEPPLTPRQCVALEDTRHGLESARAAGVFAVGVLGTEAEALLAPLADLVLPSLADITPNELVARLNALGHPRVS
jgi:HAD superfamily hydrolase (TIGR01509 family)